jgi:hypothetical protein
MLAEAVVPVSKGVLDMTARSGFLFTTIAAVSFLTIAATSSVVLAQQGPVAACAAPAKSVSFKFDKKDEELFLLPK